MNDAKDNYPLILVAEDNNDNYLLIKFLLQHYYQLIHANNGLEAVELFRQYLPQLIIMDIKMPEMDGYEATAAIRKVSVSVPIVAVTAYAFAEDRTRILKSGFTTYLAKPISPQILKTTIAHLLHKN